MVDELERYRINVRRGDNEYKISTSVLRKYFAQYVGENTATKCIIALATGYIDVVLAQHGFEVIERRRGIFIVRRAGSDGDAHGRH